MVVSVRPLLALALPGARRAKPRALHPHREDAAGDLLVIPLFGIFRMTGLIGSLWSIILAHATLIIPFTTWMLKGYFDTIPKELEQAAMVDGCSPWGRWWGDPARFRTRPCRHRALWLSC